MGEGAPRRSAGGGEAAWGVARMIVSRRESGRVTAVGGYSNAGGPMMPDESRRLRLGVTVTYQRLIPSDSETKHRAVRLEAERV